MSEAYFPDDLRLRTYAGLSETLRLEQALRTTLLTLAPVLPADGVFVNFFMKDELVVQFLAHATKARAEAMTARVPVSHDWLLKMSYERRGQCLVVNERREDPLTDEVLRNVLPEVRSYVMLRLLMDGIHYGVVCFYSTRPKAFGERHADIVRQLHNPIAINVGYSLAVYFRTAGLEMSAENRRLRENAVKASEEPLRELLARSPSLESIAQRIRRVAPYDATVIVTGESGCGKEVVATTIQQMSARRNAPFVRVNCAVLPGSLIESELFGFERGAFTGARERHAGLFEQADGGTLFLDEVGELPPEVQAKLLRVLQGQSFRRVGGDKEVTVDVRIICATNRDLKSMVVEGKFREDLYYRLNVYPIPVAPLRERPEDIEPLASHFIRQIARRYGMAVLPRLSEEALDFARRWPWPSNVRELRNVMARAVLSGEPVIRTLDVSTGAAPDVHPVPFAVRGLGVTGPSDVHGAQEGPADMKAEVNADMTFDDMQRAYFRALLERTGGRVSGAGGAAERAGMHPNTLRSRLEKLGITLRRTVG